MTIEQRAEKAADAVEWSDLYAKRRETYKSLWLAGFREALEEAAQIGFEGATSALDLSRLSTMGHATRQENRFLAEQLVAYAAAIRSLGAKQEEEK